MDTFKQYYDTIISEMSHQTPAKIANAMKPRLQAAHMVARQARRGNVGPEELAGAMDDMKNAFNELANVSAEELKQSIVQKYNELKAAMEQTNDPVQQLGDSVEYLYHVCEQILAG